MSLPMTPRRRLKRITRLITDLLVLAVVIGGLVACIRLPDSLVRWLLRPGPEARFAVEVGKLYYRPFEGLIAEDVRVFPRRVVGPAVMECARVVVEPRFSRALRGKAWIRRVQIEDGEMRPNTLWGLPPAPPRAERDPADASPVPLGTSLAIRRMQMFGVMFESMNGRLEGNLDAWSLERAHLRLSLNGKAIEADGRLAGGVPGLSAKGTASGDPHVLIPLFDGLRVPAASAIITDFTFRESLPRFEWSYEHSFADIRDYSVRFRVWLEGIEYRGVSALRADTQVELAGQDGTFTATIRPLMVVREEGTGRGGLVIRWARHGDFRLEYDAVSALDPRATSTMIGVLTNATHAHAHFAGPYHLESKGWVDLRNPAHHELEAELEAGNVGIGRHDFRECAFRFTADGQTNRLENFQANWFHGKLAGSLVWDQTQNGTAPWFRLLAGVEGCDFERLVGGLAPQVAQEYAGRLSGRVQLEGLAGATNRQAWRGEGSVRISRGRLLLLPVFGGLTEYISWAIPGVNVVLGQTDARSSFVIEDGRFRSDRIQIEGDILSLTGKGSYGMDGTLDADVQLTFLRSHTLVSKIIRIPTYLVSKLFEFRLTGTQREPHWFPVNFSRQVWYERVGGGKPTAQIPEEDGAEPRKRRWWFW